MSERFDFWWDTVRKVKISILNWFTNHKYEIVLFVVVNVHKFVQIIISRANIETSTKNNEFHIKMSERFDFWWDTVRKITISIPN